MAYPNLEIDVKKVDQAPFGRKKRKLFAVISGLGLGLGLGGPYSVNNKSKMLPLKCATTVGEIIKGGTKRLKAGTTSPLRQYWRRN